MKKIERRNFLDEIARIGPLSELRLVRLTDFSTPLQRYGSSTQCCRCSPLYANRERRGVLNFNFGRGAKNGTNSTAAFSGQPLRIFESEIFQRSVSFFLSTSRKLEHR